MAKQAVKKGAGLKKGTFSAKAFKADNNMNAVADKPMEWFIMPKGFSDALSLPGIPKGWFAIV